MRSIRHLLGLALVLLAGIVLAGAEVVAPLLDLRGRKRIQGEHIDIGCYEALPVGTTIIYH